MLALCVTRPTTKVSESGVTRSSVRRSLRLGVALLAFVLAFNSMFMMLAQTHVSSIDEIVVVEGTNNEMAVENCSGIHCNLVVDASIDISAFYFKESLDFGLPVDVADFFLSPLKKPPRHSLV